MPRRPQDISTASGAIHVSRSKTAPAQVPLTYRVSKRKALFCSKRSLRVSGSKSKVVINIVKDTGHGARLFVKAPKYFTIMQIIALFGFFLKI